MAPQACVLDTSVVVKFFTNEADSDTARALLEQVKEDRISIIVPDLLLYELCNSLRWNRSFNAKDVEDALNAVFSMGFSVREMPSHALSDSIYLAFERGITLYDAVFVMLAIASKCQLVTSDLKLVRATNGLPVNSLRDFAQEFQD